MSDPNTDKEKRVLQELKDEYAMTEGEITRALYYVLRAMHSGYCPSCNLLAPNMAFYSYLIPGNRATLNYACPQCNFRITQDEVQAVLRERNLSTFQATVFRAWSTKRLAVQAQSVIDRSFGLAPSKEPVRLTNAVVNFFENMIMSCQVARTAHATLSNACFALKEMPDSVIIELCEDPVVQDARSVGNFTCFVNKLRDDLGADTTLRSIIDRHIQENFALPTGRPIESMETATIKVKEVLSMARDLKSEHGENREYDRALIELCCDVAGWPMGRKRDMARLLDISKWPERAESDVQPTTCICHIGRRSSHCPVHGSCTCARRAGQCPTHDLPEHIYDQDDQEVKT